MKSDEILKDEVWKTVPNFPNYQVSNYGHVRNQKQIIKAFPNNHGYLKVNFWKNHKPTTKTVHKQVALLFVENPNNYPEVNHKDGNKLNNRSDNLEWCTRSHNNAHALRSGLRKNPNPKALTKEQEKEARELYENGVTSEELAEKYKVNPRTIRKYVKGVHKKRIIPKTVKEEIKRLYSTGDYTYKELARMFNVGNGTVGRAIKR